MSLRYMLKGDNMAYQEEVEPYICAALCYPLKDKQQLINMVCLPFPDVNEIIATTIVDNLIARIQELSKRTK